MAENKLVFNKKNYTLLLVGIAVLLIGFVIMCLDTEQYGFGFFGITLGPIVVALGFIIPFFAIFAKTKPEAEKVK
jgi:uncharacterized membrane protein